MINVHILTIFPEMFTGPFDYSIVKRARDKNLVKITTYDLRKWSVNSYNSVDDHPFSGGPGMVIGIEPIYKAIADIKKGLTGKTVTVLTSAKGEFFTQKLALDFTKFDNIIIICGHYEGVDERVREHLVDHEISIGKFVLSGGEIPAMVIVDSVTRLLPEALHNSDSIVDESFSEADILEYPQYTRPAVFTTEKGEDWSVPDVLLNGNHKEIQKWREQNKQHIK